MHSWFKSRNDTVGFIWFIGKGKTQQYRFSRPYLILLGMVCVFVVCSAMAGCYLFFALCSTWSESRRQIVQLKSQLFHMEVVHLDVYERVYPEHDIVDATTPVGQNETNRVPLKVGVQEPSLDRVAIRNLKISPHQKGGHLIGFELHKLNKQAVEKGYLWSIALALSPRGKMIVTTFPSEIQFDLMDFSPKDYLRAHRFQIKNFSHYTFVSEGLHSTNRLVFVKVGAHDVGGRLLTEQSFVLDTRLGSH